MRDAITTKMRKLTLLALSLDAGLWTGRWGSPEVRAIAELAKQNVVAKVERCARVLRVRYGTAVAFRCADFTLAELVAAGAA